MSLLEAGWNPINGSPPDDELSGSLKMPIDFLPDGVQTIIVGTEDFETLTWPQDIFRQELYMWGITAAKMGA